MKSVAKALGVIALLLALLWGGASRWAGARERAAMEAYPPQGQILTVGGHRVHAVVRGPAAGQAPDLVLIHGASGHTRDFTFDLVDELDDSFRVIVFDRPGFGYSDPIGPEGGSIGAQADLLQAAAQDLGADRPIVVGQSYGGAVALAWAVGHPDDLAGVVTIAGVSHPWSTPLPRVYRLLSDPLLGPLIVPFYTLALTDDRVSRVLHAIFEPDPVPQGYGDYVGAGLSLRRSSVLTNARQRAGLKAQITAMAPQYDEIRVPVAIVHGTADRIVPLRVHGQKLARDLPHATLTVLDNVGHMPHHGRNQSAVLDAIYDVARRSGVLLCRTADCTAAINRQ